MFTGIVREVGRLREVAAKEGGARLVVEAPETAAASTVGDSIAVNGVCLTATTVGDGSLAFDAVPETLERSSLGALGPGASVNVEPAVRAGEPLGGHVMQGHVDGTGRVRSLEPDGEGMRLTVELDGELERYVVEKGSIAVEGVSLTVAGLGTGWFSVALVPHTLGATTLGRLEPGAAVNLETDVLAKHVERLLEARGRLG